jgi:hypothetical protein
MTTPSPAEPKATPSPPAMRSSSAGVATSVLLRQPLPQHAVAWIGAALDARAGGCGGSVRTLFEWSGLHCRPRSCEPFCWQLAMRRRTGRPETGTSSGSGADADAASTRRYAPRAQLSRHGRSPHSRSRQGRRNRSQQAVRLSALWVLERRLRRDSPAAAPAARFSLPFR